MSKEFDESRRLFGEMFPDASKEEVDEMFSMLVDAVDKALKEAASKESVYSSGHYHRMGLLIAEGMGHRVDEI